MQPADIAQIVSVGDPRVSPDGRLVAFVVNRVDLDRNRYRSAIWLAEADGSAPPYQLTAGEHGDSQPAWSPDGRRLAFTSRRSDQPGRATLHVAPVGVPGEILTLCERPEAIEEPAWSPDGRSIAFASRERTSRYDAEDERARPPRRIDRLLSRLDGEGWIIDRPRSVFVIPADGSATPRIVAGGPYEHGGPAWSPDGTRLAVTAARHKDWDLQPVDDVFLVDPRGDTDGPAEPLPLARQRLSHRSPAFAPDGGRIATLAEDSRVVPSHAQVVVLDAVTGEQRVLTAALDRQCAPMPGARAPIWDGEAVLFSVEDRGHVHLYRVAADGSGEPERLVGGTRAVTGFDLAGGTLAFVATTPTELPELFVRDGDGTERRLTDLGAGFHNAHPALPAEHFTVPSPGGDGEVDAWLIRPAGIADGDRCPVLLSIHGGPMAQYACSWFDEFQLWASAGYAVVYCNPHGSSGFTEAWVRSIRPPEAPEAPGTGWGGIDADDVLAVLDAALARDARLDPDRVGVLGGSYGGYLTTWLIGHSDRFAAACSERAVNNLESEEWSSDAAGFFRHEFGVSHLDAPDAYRRMSPISYVRDIDTPVLILHSEDDLRCHVEQADQLFVALRLLGKPVEYWRFPEEGHNLSRTGSPKHRVQRAEIILDWFGRHLGGRRPEKVSALPG
ncbi:S9 family peptidase [Pseudonocardia bannensis]|uniref:S9 family peptidase n=1 Tax=Pseudonocardia bannensis TaxID=630973 RepID=A0A848DRF6_9PSEU|nr:S9 family peptidase [Pseudonocardia bannensis]NMH95392.1 S9 family peptidase [Pseudonocardia bannensis]